ncbi:MAG: FlaD/FlaE family flagellar protein [Nitrososphaerales archaeon]
MSDELGSGAGRRDEKAEDPSGEKLSEEAMDDIFLEVRRLIADIDNPFTLLGKLVSVIGRDKVIEEMGGESEAEKDKDNGNLGVQGQLGALPGAEAALLDALALQQLQRGMGGGQEPESRPPPPGERGGGSSRSKTQEPPQSRTREEDDDEPESAPQAASPLSSNQKQAQAADPRQSGGSTSMISPVSPRPSVGSGLGAAPGFPLVLMDRGSSQSPSKGSEPSVGQPTMDFMKRMNSLELANLLAGIFGKERTIDILGSYVNRNWISDEVAKMLVDCVTLIEKGEFDVPHRKGEELLVEDHQVALFLLDEFEKSLFNISLSLRFREMMAAMKASFYLHLPDAAMDVVDEEKMS